MFSSLPWPASGALEKRGLWDDLNAAFQYLKGDYKKAGERIFTGAWSDMTREMAVSWQRAGLD